MSWEERGVLGTSYVTHDMYELVNVCDRDWLLTERLLNVNANTIVNQTPTAPGEFNW